MAYLNNTIIENNSSAENVISYMYKGFSATCRRYTDVMAHKHELQSIIFTMDDNSSNRSVTANIILSIIKLESAALRLQNFTVCIAI